MKNLKLSYLISALATVIAIPFFSQFPFSYSQVGDFGTNNTSIPKFNNDSLNNWTTYTSDVLGISFDYPNGWYLREKENRFDSGPDVTVSEGSTKFVVTKFDTKLTNLLKSLGLADTTRALEEGVAESKEITIIEETNLNKYEVGGERTGSFLAKYEGSAVPTAAQTFIVAPKGVAFHDSTLTFDDPETQRIMDGITQSFKFLKGSLTRDE